MSRGYKVGAAMLCRNSRFRDYLAETTGRPVPNSEAAAQEVRLACEVMSRRELDTRPEAGEKYRALVKSFNAWLSSCLATT